MKKEQLVLTRSRGFTLLEVTVAIFVVTVGIGGVFGFLQQTIFLGPTLNNQLAASYLAQEGVEIVRNIRDTNYVRIALGGGGTWTDGLEGCAGNEYQGDYLSSSLDCFAGGALSLDGNFYVHGAGVATPFQRMITVTPNGANRLDVAVEVQWQERGNPYTFVVDTELYNWIGF